MRTLLNNYGKGVMHGLGFVTVLTLALAIAYAQDIFEVERDGAPKLRVTATQGVTIGSTGSYENLVIQNDGTSSNSKVNITADTLTVEYVRLTSLSVSADITVSGAGGRDAGAEAANTWYYVYVITNNDGSSSNGLLSTSSSSPTVPSGFTKKRRVGAVRNDGSSNFLQFVQEGNRVDYLDGSGGSGYRILSDGVATSFTVVSASSYISPTSLRGTFRVSLNADHNAAEVQFTAILRKTGTSGSNGQSRVALFTPAVNVGINASDLVTLDTNSSQQVDYSLSPSAPANWGGVSIEVWGYYDRI